MRSLFPSVRFAPALLVLSAGCFQSVSPDVDKIQCRSDSNCPERYVCVKESGRDFGRCVGENGDAARDLGTGDSSAQKGDGAAAEARIESDGRRPDTVGTTTPDTNAGSNASDAAVDSMDAGANAVDGGAEDAPNTVDAPLVSDASGRPDAAQDVPFSTGDTAPAGDTALPCNGGCCNNANCPLSAPVCNNANKCVGCTADQDCTGRTATACNTSSGACVQCTKNSHCSGANATCNLTTNSCVGCTQRSDCAGTCQTCNNGTCVAVKNADDPSKCTGTCDGEGECRAKKGQKCSSVLRGCMAGTFCSPDDTCCDRACTGSCEACDVAATLGTCSVLAAGSTPHTGHTPCAGADTCAGSCQGAVNGACTFPTSACGTASCTGTTYRAAGTCSQGTCSIPDPVSCKTGATCSAGVCACPSGTFDCGSKCAVLDSDPKNCGSCGHDCLGGSCEGGVCKPFQLADIAEGQIGNLAVDGGKVYAFTRQTHKLDTSKVWQMDAVTPGSAGRILPDREYTPVCVIDGTLVWQEGLDGDGNMAFGYCSVSGCLASTDTFSHPVSTTGFTLAEGYPVCDIARKEIVWVESHWEGSPDYPTYSIWRSSPTGANLRQMTSFSLVGSALSARPNGFAVGRTDRYFFTRLAGTSVQLLSVSTTTDNASPGLLGTVEQYGSYDMQGATLYANDTYLVWSSNGTSYRIPMPSGMGTNSPSMFCVTSINQGILDNYHFYGFLEGYTGMHRCTPPMCSASLLSSSVPWADVFIQDANAIYWATIHQDTYDGFSIWKVAKQPY